MRCRDRIGMRLRKEAGMRLLQHFLTLIMTVVFAGSGLAVPHGKTIDYEGWIAGKVIFDGKIHGDKGLGCTDCHPKVFPMKKETKITMAKINEGKYWGPATMVRRLSNRANRLTAKDAIIRLQLIQKH